MTNYAPMAFSELGPLIIGLGIVLDLVNRGSADSAIRDSILSGCWQGAALWYAFKSDLTVPIILGISAKMVIEYSLVQDSVQSAVTAFITVLALVAAEFMSSALDEPKERKSTSRKHSSKRNGRQATSSASRHHFSTRRPVSDITSVDSNSDLIGPRASMTPLEREIAALRARASLADSERRRYKEERKWAIAQGNLPLAAQMKWQVKKYSALMKSFHREADEKLQLKGVYSPRNMAI